VNKKILYLGNFDFPNGNSAGTRVLGIGSLLREIGYEAFYIGHSSSIKPKCKIKNTRKIYNGFIYYNLSYPSKAKDWFWYKKRFNTVISLIEKERNLKIIILYGSSGISLFARKIRKWCLKNKIIFISDVVDWLSVGYGSYLFRIIKYIDTTYRLKFINPSSDGIIVASTFLENYYKKKKCKTVIIPPLVNRDKFKSLKIKNYKKTPIKLIYVGQPFPTDGRKVKKSSYKDRLDKAIELLFQLKDLEFIFNIYGLTKKQYLSVIPKHKKMVNELGERIKFNGYLKNELVIEKVAESDFTILLRDINRMTMAGFPTKFVETVSCGTPIITTRTSDIDKYLKEGENGFFVDIMGSDNGLNEMKNILSLNKELILSMKKFCYESEAFNFINYKTEMNAFMKSI